jgi:hypothetical protein
LGLGQQRSFGAGRLVDDLINVWARQVRSSPQLRTIAQSQDLPKPGGGDVTNRQGHQLYPHSRAPVRERKWRSKTWIQDKTTQIAAALVEGGAEVLLRKAKELALAGDVTMLNFYLVEFCRRNDPS